MGIRQIGNNPGKKDTPEITTRHDQCGYPSQAFSAASLLGESATTLFTFIDSSPSETRRALLEL
jgi:hypothetical protein